MIVELKWHTMEDIGIKYLKTLYKDAKWELDTDRLLPADKEYYLGLVSNFEYVLRYLLTEEEFKELNEES